MRLWQRRIMDRLTVVCCLLFVVMIVPVASLAQGQEEPLVCGVARGFPPYQFQDEAGAPVGLDVEVLRNLVGRMGRQLVIRQEKWDNVLALLRLGKLDCVAGMEINERRRAFFDFTDSYYNRRVVVFVPADNDTILTLDDLRFRTVAGDRHSFVENYFQQKGFRQHVRLMQTTSKAQSMKMLGSGRVEAVIAPLAVGRHLAEQLHLSVRVVESGDPGSPVGIAVEAGNKRLRQALQDALSAMVKSVEMRATLHSWGIDK